MSDLLKKRARERELEKIRGKANGNGRSTSKRPMKRRPEPAVEDDPDDANSAHNLELYAMNTGELYGTRKDTTRMLLRKLKAGTYDRKEAVRHWVSWLNKAGRMYGREFGTGAGKHGTGPFTPVVIAEAAAAMTRWFEATAKTGEHDYLLEG